MTRIDLLTALGNVDSKHILEAKERAENHDEQSADSKDTVGVMSKKSFWKKAAPIAAIAASQILLFGVLIFVLSGNNRIEKDNSSNAQNQNTAVTTTVVTTDTTSNAGNVNDWCGNDGYSSQGEAVEAYFESIQSSQNTEAIDALQTSENGEIGLYVYSMKNVPEGYSIGYVYEMGGVTYHNETYRNTEDKSTIETEENTLNFHWYSRGEGEELLSDLINYWNQNGRPVNKLNGKSGYYYADLDLCYSVFWLEDGYCFDVRFPKSIGVIDSATYEYIGEDIFSLNKTFYAFDERVAQDNNDLPSDSTSYSENRTVEMMPYREGDLLYFGATVTVNQPHECDFELIVNVMDLNKGDEGLGENIPGLFQTVTKQSVSYGETITLKAAIDYNEIPDNISVMCTVITYEYVGGEEEMPVETHQLLYPQTYSKYGDVFNGDIVTDNNDLPDEALEFSETVEIHRTIQSEYGDNEIVPIEPYRADGYLYVGAYVICRTYLHTDFELAVTVYDLDNGGTEVSELADTFKDEALVYGIKDLLRIQYDYDTFPKNAEIHFEIMAYNSEDGTLYEQTEFTLEYSKENAE